jgi:two-component system NarL family sensor kinase
MYTEKTKIYIAVLVSLSLIVGILVLFIITIIKHQRKLAGSYKRQIQAEIITLEDERKRMAADLHDDLGPFLSSMKLQLNLLNTTNPEDKEVINELTDGLKTIIQKVRETSNDLIPSVLIRQGLISAIVAFCEKINLLNSIHIKSEISVKSSPFDADADLHIYRIVQEAINNCIKHSGASTFYLKLFQTENRLVLDMWDDGKGFDMRTIEKETLGLGLKNVLSRTDMLKGELFIDTQPGKGLSYRIELPIKDSEK